MKRNPLPIVLAILAVYFGLTYFGGQTGRLILYPLRLFVTFLHEFGHALGAIITGGQVEGFVINEDGSGLTASRGGNRAIILMGGYIGSALLGNFLFFIGAKKPNWSQWVLMVIAVIMIAASFIWFSTWFTTGFLIAFSIALIAIAKFTKVDHIVLMFLGLASVLYIIQDFNVGPSSDLKAYAEIFVLIPANVWMYVWLVVVVVLFLWNVKIIFKGSKAKSDDAVALEDDF